MWSLKYRICKFQGFFPSFQLKFHVFTTFWANSRHSPGLEKKMTKIQVFKVFQVGWELWGILQWQCTSHIVSSCLPTICRFIKYNGKHTQMLMSICLCTINILKNTLKYLYLKLCLDIKKIWTKNISGIYTLFDLSISVIDSISDSSVYFTCKRMCWSTCRYTTCIPLLIKIMLRNLV